MHKEIPMATQAYAQNKTIENAYVGINFVDMLENALFVHSVSRKILDVRWHNQ